MRLPTAPVPDPELTSYFGSIYRDITGGEVDSQESTVQEIVYHHNGDSQTNGRASNGSGPGQEFSEYLWMEHEDEYDREVIRELEEEDMINYYFDLYQDSLQPNPEEQEFTDAHILGDLLRLLSNGYNAPSTGNGTDAAEPGAGEGNHGNGGEDLSSSLGRILTFQSTLNPNAPEFIPRHLSNGHQDKPTSS